MRFLSLLALSLLAGCSLTARVQGRVVDDQNRPVAGARISLGMYPGGSEPEPESMLESGANGEFDGLIKFRHKGGSPVRALDPGGKRGGTAYFNRRREPVTITVYPLTRVHGRVSYARLPASIREWNERSPFGGRSVLIQRRLPQVEGKRPSPEHVAQGRLEEGEFEFMLPPGDYELQARGAHEALTAAFTVTPGQETDLGTLEARPRPEQALYDGPAPELKLADARGIPKDFQWSTLRGRWVILFFWDHRNRGHNWLPYLAETWHQGSEHRDKFEIIAVHNGDSVLKVPHLEDELMWSSEDRRVPELPFPVAIDDGDRSFTAFGIERGMPRRGSHLFVINPEGRVEFVKYHPPIEYVRQKLEPQAK